MTISQFNHITTTTQLEYDGSRFRRRANSDTTTNASSTSSKSSPSSPSLRFSPDPNQDKDEPARKGPLGKHMWNLIPAGSRAFRCIGPLHVNHVADRYEDFYKCVETFCMAAVCGDCAHELDETCPDRHWFGSARDKAPPFVYKTTEWERMMDRQEKKRKLSV